MRGTGFGRGHTEKIKCKNCGCTIWHLFGTEQDYIPMCTKCGAFPWFEPGDEEENVIEKQGILGHIVYLIREVFT